MTQDKKKIKICYIFPSALPSKNASSLQTAKMADALSSKAELIIFLPNTGYRNISIKKFYNLKNKLNVFRLSKFKEFPLGFNYYLFSIISIIKSIKFKPNFYITRIFIVSFFLTILKKKHILEIHNDMNVEGRVVKFIFKRLNFFNSKYLIKIITTTNSLKLHYIKHYNVNENKINILPNGSSINKFYLSYKKKILNVGYFGSIYKSRGLDKICYLARFYKNLNFYVYGGEKEEVFKLKQKFKNRNIHFHSYVNQKILEKRIFEMDILLLPYTNKITVAGDVGNIFDYTSPLKMFDYLASGKIIIASEIEVLKEVLKDKKNCFFVKNYLNKNAWRLKLNQILVSDTKRIIVSNNAFNDSKKFTTKIRAKKFISFFENQI